jgi:hypothetical protein
LLVRCIGAVYGGGDGDLDWVVGLCIRYDNGGRRRRRRRQRTCVCFVGDDDNNIDCDDDDGDNNDDVDDLTPTRCIHATQQVQRSQIDVSCSALA